MLGHLNACSAQLSDLSQFFLLVLYCFQQVSDMPSHLLSCLHLDLSEIIFFNCP